MFDVRSIIARLSTEDNMSYGINKAFKNVQKLGKEIKSGFAFGLLTGAGQAAFNTLKNGAVDLISEIDSSNASWKTFTKNMQMLGKSEKEIASVKSELQDFAQKTIYSSSDMATTFAQLEAVGVKNTTSLVKGFGGLAAAAENPQQAMKTLSQQATQMAAKPSVAWQDFKLMLEQTPAGIAAVAKEMGMTTSELVTNVQDGKIATDKFFDAIAKVGTNKAFTELATEAKTVGQAMDGLKETVGNKLTPAFEVLNKKGISIINRLGDKLSGIDADALANKVSNMVEKVGNYLSIMKDAFSGVGSEVWGALKEIGSALSGVTGEFGSTESMDTFKSAMQGVADIIKSVAGFAKEHASAIATFIKWLPAIVLGIKGFKIASAVAPGVTAFAKGIGGLVGKGISGIASKLFGISKSQTTVGTTSATSGTQMLTAAKSYALMGVAVLAIAAGFALLAFSAISLANAGGGAIAVMAGLVVALVGIGVGMAVLLKTLAPMSGQLMPVATAFLAMGAAVLLVSAGFALLAFSSIALANAGGAAIGVMVGMLAAIALLAIGAAALAPALTAGAVGLIAFGAAVLMVGAGFALMGAAALMAATALQIIATVLPALVASGLQGALAITALGGSLVVFAAGAALAGAAAIVLGAGLVVAAVGVAALGVAIVVLAAGITLLSVGAMVAAGAISLLALTFPQVAANGTLCAAALLAMGAAMIVFGAGAIVAGASAVVLAAGMIAMGAGMLVGVAGTVAMAAALKGVNSQMKSIAKNAKSAEGSLKTMRSSIKVVESGLNALGSKVQSAMKKVVSAFDSTASKAEASGRKVGTGFTKGLQSGLAQAPMVAAQATMQVSTTLNTGRSSAFGAGSFVSQGFAQGMLSMLGVIQSAASKMAAAADKAIRAKAKIHSPSKISTEDGEDYGQGWVNGILSKAKEAWNAAEKLVSMPTVATPDLAMAYSGELSSDYDYYRQSEYTIEVPLSVDGREFARATASYTQDELDKKQARNSRKHGVI